MKHMHNTNVNTEYSSVCVLACMRVLLLVSGDGDPLHPLGPAEQALPKRIETGTNLRNVGLKE
jgi:hypothetical protein